jgi:hypothetical protein
MIAFGLYAKASDQSEPVITVNFDINSESRWESLSNSSVRISDAKLTLATPFAHETWRGIVIDNPKQPQHRILLATAKLVALKKIWSSMKSGGFNPEKYKKRFVLIIQNKLNSDFIGSGNYTFPGLKAAKKFEMEGNVQNQELKIDMNRDDSIEYNLTLITAGL